MIRKAAAIDVGSEKMHVGINGQKEVNIFECFPDSLQPANVEEIIATASVTEPKLTAIMKGVMEKI